MQKKEDDINEYLVIQLQSGNTIALTELVKRWHKLFCEKAYWLVKDKEVAKDIAQDGWAIIMQRIDTLKEPKLFKYWAYRIICNKSMDWLRLQSINHLKFSTSETEIEDNEEDYSETSELINKMKLAIKELPANQKEVLKLFYTESYTLKQISELLNISIGTAKSRLFHAREKLKLTLKH